MFIVWLTIWQSFLHDISDFSCDIITLSTVILLRCLTGCPHLSHCLPGSSGVGRLEHAQYGSLDVECPHLLGFPWAQAHDLSPLKTEPQGVLLQRLSVKNKTPDGPPPLNPSEMSAVQMATQAIHCTEDFTACLYTFICKLYYTIIR